MKFLFLLFLLGSSFSALSNSNSCNWKGAEGDPNEYGSIITFPEDMTHRDFTATYSCGGNCGFQVGGVWAAGICSPLRPKFENNGIYSQECECITTSFQ